MAWETQKQATEALKRAKRALVLAPENPTHDALASTTAVLAYLHAHNIPADGFIPNFKPEKFPLYLPSADKIQAQVNSLRDLKIQLDVNQVPIKELTYDVKDGRLEIILTPKSGEWKTQNISLYQGDNRYDMIVAIGFPDRQSLHNAFRQPMDVIHQAPIINLDNDPKNEHWAAINLVDLAATAISENAFNWFEHWDETKISAPIATAILAGMIANTQSFRSPSVTPNTLEKASKLISMGADRESIVHGLWRSRQVNTLKLWGRALSRIEQDKNLGLIWTTLSRQDILDSGTTEARLDELVNELIAFAPDSKLTAIFVEHDAYTTRMALFAQPPYAANVIGRSLGLDGTAKKAGGAISKPLLEAKDHALEQIKKIL